MLEQRDEQTMNRNTERSKNVATGEQTDRQREETERDKWTETKTDR
jgi:hypothetical protein